MASGMGKEMGRHYWQKQTQQYDILIQPFHARADAFFQPSLSSDGRSVCNDCGLHQGHHFDILFFLFIALYLVIVEPMRDV